MIQSSWVNSLVSLRIHRYNVSKCYEVSKCYNIGKTFSLVVPSLFIGLCIPLNKGATAPTTLLICLFELFLLFWGSVLDSNRRHAQMNTTRDH